MEPYISNSGDPTRDKMGELAIEILTERYSHLMASINDRQVTQAAGCLIGKLQLERLGLHPETETPLAPP